MRTLVVPARKTVPAAAVRCLCLVFASSAVAAAAALDVRDFGARPDGTTLCTQAIQKAIDHCAGQGGGTVRVPPGNWLSGTIFLKSNVTLLLDAGSTLLGSRNREDYLHPPAFPDRRPDSNGLVVHDLIVGVNLQHVAIRGQGAIDGNGSAFYQKELKDKKRPKAIMLTGCRDVMVEGLTLRNAGSWMQHYRNCDRVVLRGITVFNHASYNNDGLDVDGCQDVVISDCTVDSDDDALCLKSTSDRPCRNVAVKNCTLSSHCNAIKMGTESGGGFQNITVAGCKVFSPRHSKVIYGRQRGLAGIALEIVDGGRMDRVAISDITIEGVTTPIFLRLGNRGRSYGRKDFQPRVGTLENVSLKNIVATKASSVGCSITGLPGHTIENVSLQNIQLSFDGGESAAKSSAKVPERPESYPECTMYGTLPAYGFYCRHVKGVKLSKVQLRTEQPDQRHALVCDDVEDVLIDGLDAQYSPGGESLLRLVQAKGVRVSACRPQLAAGTFLRLEGNASQGIVLLGNDFSQVGKVAETADEVPQGAFMNQADQTMKKP